MRATGYLRHRRAGLCCAAALMVAATVASAQSGGELITPNFKDADIGQIAEAVSMATHKNFILDPRVRAQVTMFSATPMSPDAFYQTFLSILQVHGFMAAPAGDIVKIMPDVTERYMPGDDLPAHVSSTSDEIVTQVVQVRNVSAAQLVPVLRPLIPTQGHLAAYQPANILIISDRAANVSRLMHIIERIDQTDTSAVDVIPMQNATATEVARVVSSLYQGQGAGELGGAPLKIVADDRSNSILLSGDPNARLHIKALIAHLDTPHAGAYEGDTQVRYLKYEDATKLAPKLKEQITGMEEAAASTRGGPAGLSSPSGTAAGKDVQVWADEQNNALVMTAPPKTMRELNAILDQLDIRRAQVLVQAIIVDVDFDKATELGVNWAIYSQGSTVPGATFLTPVGGASLVDLADSIINPANLPSTGLVNGTTVALGRIAKTGISFAAMLRALQSSDDSNIIATPSTVTMDHQEAKIDVAEEVPFVTGQYTNASTVTAGTVTPFQTIQNEEVGTILKITPDINNNNLILKIDVESSSVIPTAQLEAAGQSGSTVNPTTQKRTVTTQVLIENGGILVIGGLISNEYDRTQTGVPLLSHIPLLGQLFQDRQGTIEKKNLMIFIRAQILRDGTDSATATDQEYDYIRKEQKQVGGKELFPLVPGAKSSILPAPPPGSVPSTNKGCCDIAPLPPVPPKTSHEAPVNEQEKRQAAQRQEARERQSAQPQQDPKAGSSSGASSSGASASSSSGAATHPAPSTETSP
ncbi:MAG TPA: type II secretion system secretin GspD [Steroidobacteraceae bacterium]|nr:type II secretion system secretin GspD [Steroidobacteraceae bacterium]